MCLTYLGRSLKVNKFWVNVEPQGRSTETSNSVLGWGEHGEIDTLILSDSSPMPFSPVQYQPNSVEAHSTFRRSWINFRPSSESNSHPISKDV